MCHVLLYYHTRFDINPAFYVYDWVESRPCKKNDNIIGYYFIQRGVGYQKTGSLKYQHCCMTPRCIAIH